nr:hypothetical protein [Tanacetum cinerariifolium]
MAKVHITYLETPADIGLLPGFKEGEKETYECLSQWCSYHLVSRVQSNLNSLVPVDEKPDKPKQLVPKAVEKVLT